MRTGLVVLLLALIALFFLNPNMDDFKVFVEAQSEEIILSETGDTALGRALSALGGGLAGSFVDRVTERDDYLFFSTYRIDLGEDGDEEDDWTFIGVAGQFFETGRPAALEGGEESGP